MAMSALTPDNVILGLLAESPKHGYDILSYFGDVAHLGRIWKLSTSQIYNVLKRLEAQGTVIGDQIITENAPPRTRYTLTDDGILTLEEWLDEPYPSPSVRKIRVEFLSRLYVTYHLNRSPNAIIQRQRQACIAELARLQGENTSVEIGIEGLVRHFTIAQLQAIVPWLNQCDQLFSGGIK